MILITSILSPSLSDSLSLQEAHAMQEKISAQYKNEIDMAKAQRDYELKKAAYDIEVNTKRAESEMAYQLQVRRRAQEAAHIFICSLSWIYFKYSAQHFFYDWGANVLNLLEINNIFTIHDIKWRTLCLQAHTYMYDLFSSGR